MTTKQGDVSLLNDPVAQELLRSTVPARFAYNWEDGTPRVVPIWFHWNGQEIVLGTPTDAPKMAVLKDGAKVALTIDSDDFPHKVLLVRGSVHIDTVEGGQAWVNQMSTMSTRMSRVFVRPEWVGILDFQTRFPSALERAMEQAQAGV